MTVQITNAIRDCGPRYAQGLGTISSAMKHSEKMTPCAARDEELVEFVGAGVEEDDGESVMR